MVIDLQFKGGCSAIFHAYDEPDVERLMQSPFGMIGSDGSLTRPGDGSPHPRAFGTYPRVLGHYVRERGVLTLEEAVRKMTSFPAARLGLRDRGLLQGRPGRRRHGVRSGDHRRRATFTDPHHYSVGRALRRRQRPGHGEGRRPHRRPRRPRAARAGVRPDAGPDLNRGQTPIRAEPDYGCKRRGQARTVWLGGGASPRSTQRTSRSNASRTVGM